MTPKMKATLDEEIREAARKLFLSSSVADLCKNEATPKQEEFLLHVFQAELAAREENKRHRLMKRAGFPTYKTFESYEYGHIQFPPSRRCLAGKSWRAASSSGSTRTSSSTAQSAPARRI